MKSFYLGLCAFAFCLMLASIAFSKPDATKIYKHEKFRISVPTDVAVTKKVVMDFDVLSLTRKKTRLLGIYAGGHPHFPSDDAPPKKPVVAAKINGLEAKSLQWQDKKGLYSGETLIEINQEWARVLHFYYGGLSKENSLVAEKIIHSVRVNPKKDVGGDKESFVPVN